MLFALFLVGPWLIKTTVTEVRIEEKKKVLEFPKSLDGFAENFDSYFSQNFGGRFIGINTYAHIKKEIFGSSLHEELTLWRDSTILLCNGPGMRSLTTDGRISTETLRKKFRHWRFNKSEVNKRGSAFVKACFPDKTLMLDDLWPLSLRVASGVTRMEKIAEHIKEYDEGLTILDMRALFRAKMREGKKIYERYDTHWNSYGGFLAYREVLNSIKHETGIVPLDFSDFEIKWKDDHEGDLVAMTGFRPDQIWERNPYYSPKKINVITEKSTPDSFDCKAYVHLNKGSLTDKTLLVFCDSYTKAMMQFYDLHFRKAVYLERTISFSVVDELEPDLVVDSYVERSFR